ncbi:EF-hand domain-containing protein, partial [Streptomyces laurentii]|uniref:EF-hand domain-containing protein n=1 Tax=Streptomyces laurentii TaxID=39478 RepID=UPI0036799379
MLGQVQKSNIDRVFDTLDVTRDGVIGADDFRTMAQRMVALRVHMEPRLLAEIQGTFAAWWETIRQAADVEGNGHISREEFTAAAARGLDQDPEYVDKMIRVSEVTFRAADEEGDGLLTRSQVERIYQAFGVDEALSAETFRRIDLNGDGTVSIEEFVSAARDVWTAVQLRVRRRERRHRPPHH